MSAAASAFLCKFAYGVAFAVVLPLALVLWARRLDAVLALPTPVAWARGWWIAGAGLALVLSSMLMLRVVGGGLPMNAFPPPRAVDRGPYRLMAHPIYVGASAVAFGVAFATGSAAGAWIVAPMLALGSIALVLGYERADLVRRFGRVPGGTFVRLPDGVDAPRTLRDACSAWLGLQLPFLVLFELVAHLPVPDAFLLGAGERGWPVYVWTTPIYSLAYPLAFLAPMACRTSRELRRWILDAWLAVGIGLLAFIAIPGIAPPRAFDADAAFGWLLALEQADGVAGRGSLPSFHAFWAVHAARAFLGRGPVAAGLAFALAAMIAVSCVTTGMHASIDVAAGVGLAGLVAWRGAAWRTMLRWTERVANSWREWRFGPVRVLSHAVYPGAAAAIGVAIVGGRIGATGALGACALGVASLVGACVWGQFWTGSSRLLRPFGYFGSVLALALATPVLALAMPRAFDGWALAGALVLAAPVVQAVGRLRCLVQGCCHGRETRRAHDGIRYRHPRSRVLTVAGLSGVPLHATPLYSILANAVLAVLLWRFDAIGAPASLLLGGYLILSGLARFVEESLRGEPQTQVYGGLRLYQWCAAASVAAGIAASCVRSPALPPAPEIGAVGAIAIAANGLALGALHAFAMGVDFPRSNRRFARLADA